MGSPDLWDPPIREDESSDFGGNFVENWLQSDFYNGYGFYDAMEEDALNEQACRQVLKIMLSKAETDIEELEKEIAMLQSQLDRADDVWSKKHSALAERSNSLIASIQRLKDEEQRIEDVPEFHLQRLGEQAEKQSVLLKTLLESYSSNKDVQSPLIQNSTPNIEKLAASQSKEGTELSNSKAIACGSNILEKTVEPLYVADPTRDAKEKGQNEGTTSLITDCCRPATEVPIQSDMDKANLSIHTEQETDNQDLTAEAEKRMYTAEVDKQANAVMINTSAGTLSTEAGSNCIKGSCNNSEEKAGGIVVNSSNVEIIVIDSSPEPEETTMADADQDAAKQMAEESILKRKLKMQEDASRTNLMNTRKQLVTQRVRTENPPKRWLLSDPEFNSESTIGESLEEQLKNRSGKAQLVDQVQKTEVVGKEPPKSNLVLKSGIPIQAQNFFPKYSLIPEPSLAMEMELNFSSIKNFEGNMISWIPIGHAGENCGYKENNKGTHLDFQSITADVNLDPTEKGNKCLASPSTKKNVQVNLEMDEGVPSSMLKEDGDALLKPVDFLPILDSLSLPQLRAMAKERNLKKYHKLKKSDLIKLLL